MKRIIFAFIILVSSATFAQHKYYKIEYYYTAFRFGAGKEFISYKIALDWDKKGKLVYTVSCDTGASAAFIEEFSITEEMQTQLNISFNENNIIETENQFKEKQPEDTTETEFAKISYVNIVPEGSERPVVLKSMSTPVFPKDDVRNRLRDFYDAVRSTVPAEIWKKVAAP